MEPLIPWPKPPAQVLGRPVRRPCPRKPDHDCNKVSCVCFDCWGCDAPTREEDLCACPHCRQVLCRGCWEGGADSHDCYSIWRGAKTLPRKPEGPPPKQPGSK